MQGNRSAEWAVLAASALLIVFAAVRASDVVADPEAGAETYNTVCKGCHGVSIAPTLRGVVGRRIASVASFAGYSDALKAKSSMSWSEANLDAFLTAPGTFAPGTLMTQAITDAQRRADLIAYLGMLPPPR
jgi:cytochrome c